MTLDPRPIVIMDTNALLDWRVFKDPAAQPVAQAIEAGTVRWLASPSMEQEWHQVWPRSYLKHWAPDPMLTLTVLATPSSWTNPRAAPAAARTLTTRCSSTWPCTWAHAGCSRKTPPC